MYDSMCNVQNVKDGLQQNIQHSEYYSGFFDVLSNSHLIFKWILSFIPEYNELSSVIMQSLFLLNNTDFIASRPLLEDLHEANIMTTLFVNDKHIE